MSSNRLRYDNHAYKCDLSQSTGSLFYNLNPLKFEHTSKCRHELGLVAGNDVSIIKGNVVDLESDLRNQTRPASNCPSQKYHPSSDAFLRLPAVHGLPSRHVDTTALHLPSCQMIRYAPVALPMTSTLTCASK